MSETGVAYAYRELINDDPVKLCNPKGGRTEYLKPINNKGIFLLSKIALRDTKENATKCASITLASASPFSNPLNVLGE